MSSYFDYFCGRENDQIRGTCNSMCPDEEIKLRTGAQLVHVLEVLGSERKLIKSYSRSAADMHMAVPRLLRPYSVLIQTVQYLLLEITTRVDIPRSVVYDFVNDRLRAVRQDMTIQRLPADECANLLEPMVRFYVYYGYVLSDLPVKDFDPVLNKKYLLECTKWCLNCYDCITQKPDKDKEVVERLAKFLGRLDVKDNSEKKMACDKALMESLYILCNLDNVHPLYRYMKLPKEMRREPKVQLAYKIAIANVHGNFVKVCRLMDKLCLLTYCAVFSYLPTLQRRSLQVLSHGYHNKRLTVPSDVIARWLHFSDRQEAIATCEHYGLKVDDGAVRFDKTEFKVDVGMHQLKTQDLKKKFHINDVLYIYTSTSN